MALNNPFATQGDPNAQPAGELANPFATAADGEPKEQPKTMPNRDRAGNVIDHTGKVLAPGVGEKPTPGLDEALNEGEPEDRLSDIEIKELGWDEAFRRALFSWNTIKSLGKVGAETLQFFHLTEGVFDEKDAKFKPQAAYLAFLLDELGAKITDPIFEPLMKPPEERSDPITPIYDYYGIDTSTGSTTPLLDGLIEHYKRNYGFGPDGMNGFKRFIVENPGDFISDVLLTLTVFGKGVGLGAKAAKQSAAVQRLMKTPLATKWAAQQAKLARPAKRAIQTTRRGIDKVGTKIGKRIDVPYSAMKQMKFFQYLDEKGIWNKVSHVRDKVADGFTAPGIEPNFLQKVGHVADVLDPGNIAIRATLGGVKLGSRYSHRAIRAVGDKVLRPHAGQINPEQVERLKRLGIDPDEVSAAFKSSSEEVATKIMQRVEDSDVTAIARIRAFEEALLQKFEQMKNSIDFEATSIDSLGAKIKAAITEYDEIGNNLIRALYEGIDGFMQKEMLTLDPVADIVFDLAKEFHKTRLLMDRSAASLEGAAELQQAGQNILDWLQDPQFEGGSNSNLQQMFDQLMGNEQQGGGGASTPPPPKSGVSRAGIEADVFGSNVRTAAAGSAMKNEYQVEYRIGNLDDAKTSHTIGGQKLAESEYRGALQTREISLSRVSELASNMKPEWMIKDTGLVKDGSPFLTNDMEVSVANHRTLALKYLETQKDKSTGWQEYQDTLDSYLDSYGLRDEYDSVVAAGGKPFIYRKVVGDIDDVKFARDGNVETTGRQSTGEQAMSDAHLLDDDVLSHFKITNQKSLEDMFENPANKDFLEAYLNKFSSAEREGLEVEVIDAKGKKTTTLTRDGKKQLADALRLRVYSGEYGVQMWKTFLEIQEEGFKNIEKGIRENVPALVGLELDVKFGNVIDSLSIAEDVALAAETMRKIRKQGTTIQDFRGQQGLPGMPNTLTEHADLLLEVMERAKRKPKVLTDVLNDYVDSVRGDIGADAQNLFGADAQTKTTHLMKAIGKHKEELDAVDISELFDESTQGKTADNVTKTDDSATAEEGKKAEDGAAADETGDPDAAKAADDAKKGQEKKQDVTMQQKYGQPLLVENVEVTLRHLKRQIRNDYRNKTVTTKTRYYQSLINGLQESIAQTAEMYAAPDLAERIREARLMTAIHKKEMSEGWGKRILDSVDDDLVPGQDKYAVLRKAMLNKDNSIATIEQNYKYLGGRDSTAGRALQRSFLEDLLEIPQTGSDNPGRAFNAKALHNALGKYTQAELEARLNPQVVADLYDISNVLRSMEQFFRKRSGSPTGPIQRLWKMKPLFARFAAYGFGTTLWAKAAWIELVGSLIVYGGLEAYNQLKRGGHGGDQFFLEGFDMGERGVLGRTEQAAEWAEELEQLPQFIEAAKVHRELVTQPQE